MSVTKESTIKWNGNNPAVKYVPVIAKKVPAHIVESKLNRLAISSPFGTLGRFASVM